METLTLLCGNITRPETFEMWLWKRMERIKWTERVTHERVLRGVEKRGVY